MATRPLPDPDGIEYVPYVDQDEDDATVQPPQALRPALVVRPHPVPAARLVPEPAPAASSSTRMLLTMAAVAVLLVAFLMLVVHSHVPQAARAAQPATAPEAARPAKPSAYGEPFNPTAPRHRTKRATAPTPPPEEAAESTSR